MNYVYAFIFCLNKIKHDLINIRIYYYLFFKLLRVLLLIYLLVNNIKLTFIHVYKMRILEIEEFCLISITHTLRYA